VKVVRSKSGKRLTPGVRLASALALFASLASAQGAGQTPANDASSPGGRQVVATATVTSGADPAANLTPQQMVQQAGTIVEKITQAHQSLSSMLGDSKNKRDVVLVLCVSDKANQVQLALDTAKERSKAMNEALESGDDQRARHEFRLLVVVGDSVQEITVDASQCVGGEDVPTEWSLIANVDSSVPKMDPKEPSFVEVTAVVPVVGSPTQ
jgi:hypothetical protein